MLIKIISGIYGHVPKLPDGQYSDTVIPVTRFDPPIDVDEETAKMLVEKGVAKYADGEPVATGSEANASVSPMDDIPEDETPNNGISDGLGALPFDELYTTDMRADELRAAMRERGLPVKIGMSKQAMVDALNGSQPPELTAQDVIEA